MYIVDKSVSTVLSGIVLGNLDVYKRQVFNRHDIEKKIVNKLEFNAITTKTNRYFIRYT